MDLLIDFEDSVLRNVETIGNYAGGTKKKRTNNYAKDMANQFVNRLNDDELLSLFSELLGYGMIQLSADGSASRDVEECLVILGEDYINDHFAYSQVKY